MRDVSKMFSVAAIAGILSISALPNEQPKKVDLIQPVGILEIELKQKPREFFSHGSGVFITPTRFLTAAHVIDKMPGNPTVAGRVRMEDGSLYNIIKVDIEPNHDVAYVTVDKPYKGYIPEISCEAQPRGTQLTTVGNPLVMEFVEVKVTVAGGRPPARSTETVSEQDSKKPKLVKPDDIEPQKQIGRAAKPSNLNGQEFFQGVALPGQSGSPMFTEDGKVVGVLSISIMEMDIGSFTGLGLYVKTAAVCAWLKSATQK